MVMQKTVNLLSKGSTPFINSLLNINYMPKRRNIIYLIFRFYFLLITSLFYLSRSPVYGLIHKFLCISINVIYNPWEQIISDGDRLEICLMLEQFTCTPNEVICWLMFWYIIYDVYYVPDYKNRETITSFAKSDERRHFLYF